MGSVNLTNAKIDGKVSNKSTVKQAANIAIGENNTANMGSVNIKGGVVGKTGVITNTSDVKQAANIAIGKGNEASMGSVQVQ
ncbi:MAG: hypothetical protein VR65_24640 [Desulfobulbaceae bacterium BRH_c16a]|nr:MAG: hypothetical protein VR65_24640 [Desulfobulbaceae bacterium BRH_c16a]